VLYAGDELELPPYELVAAVEPLELLLALGVLAGVVTAGAVWLGLTDRLRRTIWRLRDACRARRRA
jgi:hypothetical protein